MCQANAALHILHYRAYGHFNLAQSSKRCVYAIELCKREGAKEEAGWSLALSLPLLWCHKCEPELWIFTSVQRTNPMSIKGYRAAAKEQERREGDQKKHCVMLTFVLFLLHLSWLAVPADFIAAIADLLESERERERERVNWNMIFYDVYLTQSKTTWLDSAANSADHRHNLFKQFATCMYNIDLPRLVSPHCHAIQRVFGALVSCILLASFNKHCLPSSWVPDCLTGFYCLAK